ncbi:hypothetical protein E4H12_08470 [Candidatus Thorarchaeota archaeon]|nr:MAG: hypothetical protein E4H12_08470 [Candidatus Thorarchaeota archaeon]
MIDIDNPPKEIINWIKRVKRCFTEQPDGVWFYVADSRIYIMACNENGGRAMAKYGEVDPDYEIDSIPIQDIDGGGW